MTEERQEKHHFVIAIEKPPSFIHGSYLQIVTLLNLIMYQTSLIEHS